MHVHHAITRTATIGALATGLAGLTPVLLAAPAQARETFATTTSVSPSRTVVTYGDTINIGVEVSSQSGSAPDAGTSTLYAMPATASSWTAIATNTAAGVDFLEVQPQLNTAYKVAYTGHKASSSSDDSYTSSESEVFTVTVKRSITRPAGGFVLKGQVLPGYEYRPLVVKVSQKKKTGYARWKVIRTDGSGYYRVRLPRRQGTWYWSVLARGDESYRRTSFRWQTWVS